MLERPMAAIEFVGAGKAGSHWLELKFEGRTVNRGGIVFALAQQLTICILELQFATKLHASERGQFDRFIGFPGG